MHVQLLLWLYGHKVDLLGLHTCGASHLHITRGSIVILVRDIMEETGNLMYSSVTISPLVQGKIVQEQEECSILKELSKHQNGTIVRQT